MCNKHRLSIILISGETNIYMKSEFNQIADTQYRHIIQNPH